MRALWKFHVWPCSQPMSSHLVASVTLPKAPFTSLHLPGLCGWWGCSSTNRKIAGTRNPIVSILMFSSIMNLYSFDVISLGWFGWRDSFPPIKCACTTHVVWLTSSRWIPLNAFQLPPTLIFWGGFIALTRKMVQSPTSNITTMVWSWPSNPSCIIPPSLTRRFPLHLLFMLLS